MNTLNTLARFCFNRPFPSENHRFQQRVQHSFGRSLYWIWSDAEFWCDKYTMSGVTYTWGGIGALGYLHLGWKRQESGSMERHFMVGSRVTSTYSPSLSIGITLITINKQEAGLHIEFSSNLKLSCHTAPARHTWQPCTIRCSRHTSLECLSSV